MTSVPKAAFHDIEKKKKRPAFDLSLLDPDQRIELTIYLLNVVTFLLYAIAKILSWRLETDDDDVRSPANLDSISANYVMNDEDGVFFSPLRHF